MVLYTKFDVQRLAEIVGTERAGHMINSKKSVHMFVTGENGWKQYHVSESCYCWIIMSAPPDWRLLVKSLKSDSSGSNSVDSK